jgi:hypothetical protein
VGSISDYIDNKELAIYASDVNHDFVGAGAFKNGPRITFICLSCVN